MRHTPGPWTAFETYPQRHTVGTPNGKICDLWGMDPAFFTDEDQANLRLIAASPTMLDAIETAGRIVSQVLDNPRMSADERASALSRACDALGGTYSKITGTPLSSAPSTTGRWQPGETRVQSS